jgi:O-antigen ligase
MTPLAAATGVQAAAALLAALAAGAVLLAPTARARAWAMPAALVLAALTVAAVSEDQVREQVSGRTGLLAVAALAGLGALLVLGGAFRRWPAAFVVAAAVALPVRIPVTVGGETANLLLPLYAVIAGGVLAALLAARHAPEAPDPSRRPGVWLERALAGVVVLYAAQALYSTDVEAAAKDVAFFYAPFAVLFRLLLDAPWSRRLVLAVFGTVVALAVVFAVIGLYQYATRTTILSNEKVLLANELKPYFRVNSLFYDPNIYGRFLALAMLLVAAALLWAGRRRTVWLAAAALLVLWAGLVPSLSESSFAALAVGLGVLAALRWSWRPVLGAAVVVAAVAAVVVAVAPSAVGIETGTFDELNRSTSGRAELVQGGLEMWRDRPLGGFGSGSFAERYRDRENLLSPRSPAESHTIPVTVVAEQGAVGLLAYVALLAASLAFVLGRVRRRATRAAVAAAYVALVVHTLVYAAFLEDPLAWTLLAVAIALRRGRVEDDQAPATERGRARRREPVAT